MSLSEKYIWSNVTLPNDNLPKRIPPKMTIVQKLLRQVAIDGKLLLQIAIAHNSIFAMTIV
jgi:hypothetical protein